MKQLIILFLLILTACNSTNSKPKQTSTNLDQEPAIENSIIDEEVENNPDYGFEYFLTNFDFNPEFQKSRISFPLEFNNKTNVTFIDSLNWKKDPLFTNLEAVTDVSNGLDSKITDEAVFSWIHTKSMESKNYFFKKIDGKWFLVKINLSIDTVESSSENFYTFLSRFCSDSTFQVQRINFPIKVTYLDEDYEGVTESTTIEKWRYINVYYNCDSIATTYNNFEMQFTDTDERILYIKGVENGINAFLKFKRIDNKWMLIESNDSST
jgi:hypothetical protein